MASRTVAQEYYRFGFNGQERDDDVSGVGNTYNTELRILDTRLGKWLSLDPMAAKFSWQSPYVSMDNNPISIIDPTGGEGTDWYRDGNGNYKWFTGSDAEHNEGGTTWSRVDENGGIGHVYTGKDGRQIELLDGPNKWQYIQNLPTQGDYTGPAVDYSMISSSVGIYSPGRVGAGEDGAMIADALAYAFIGGAAAIFVGGPLIAAVGVEEVAKEGVETVVEEAFGIRIYDPTSITNISRQFTKSSIKLGKKMHDAYKVGAKGVKEFRLPSGKRIDFLDINNGIIYELKPFNPRAIKKGQNQLNNYLEELQSPATLLKHPELKGINWKTTLEIY